MPHLPKVIAALLVGATLTACHATTGLQTTGFGNQQPSADESTVSPPGSTFTVGLGQTFSVVLPGTGEAGGYQWHLDDTYNQSVVRMVGEHPGSLPSNPQPGQFAPEVFVFEGDAAGSTTLHFSQYRSFESSSQAIATATHPVMVH
ncbi:MAG TPA: protease inhibitor I42 family protein [Oscillatoriaceae cyanobacterium]